MFDFQQRMQPIFKTNEYGLANFLIKMHVKQNRPFISSIELNNALALLEGFSQKYYNRPLVNYQRYFEIYGTHYYLPYIYQEYKTHADYITEEIEHARFEKDGSFTVIKYPNISKDAMENVTEPNQVFIDIKDSTLSQLMHSPAILNTVITHHTNRVLASAGSFTAVKPAVLSDLYNNYIYTLKTQALNAPQKSIKKLKQ